MASNVNDGIQNPRVRRVRSLRESLRAMFESDPIRFLHIIRNHINQPASKSEIEKLEEAYRKDLLGQQCPICLCKYKRSETALSMPCKHNFHELCLKTWLAKSNFCPLCKFKLKIDNDLYDYFSAELIRRQLRENINAEH